MIKLTDSKEYIQESLAREFYAEANRRIRRNSASALAQAKAATLSFLIDTDTYRSLVSGELAYHFGFHKGTEESVLQPILNTFVNSIHYDYKPFSRRGGGFSFFGIADDYSDVLSLPEAHIVGKNRPSFTTQYPLPWLNWLLLQGDQILVKGYEIEIGAIASRSGKAVMIKGGTWQIPKQFKGSALDNWVTRISPKGLKAVSEYDRTLQKILEGLLV